MGRLSATELARFEADGFVVIDCPWPAELTESCLEAVALARVQDPEAVAAEDTIGNHWKLPPVTVGSYWSAADHALPFLSIITHPEVVEIGQQLADEDDIWLRNGGINELAPGRCVFWHHDGGDDTVEFMHYPGNGATLQNGCLRVIPGRLWSREATSATLANQLLKVCCLYSHVLAVTPQALTRDPPSLPPSPSSKRTWKVNTISN